MVVTRLDMDAQRVPAVAVEERVELVVGDAGEHRRVRDLVPVQVQDRQHGAVADRVQELVRVPRRRERARLRLAVSDDARDNQVGVVVGGAVGVRERVAELAALVDRAGHLGRGVARDPPREGELAEELLHALGVLGDVRVQLVVRPLEVRVRDHRRPAVARPTDVDHVQVFEPDLAVQVRVDEVQARRRAPVAEQAGLHVLERQRLPEQRIVEQVDLADGQEVGRTPVPVEKVELLVGQRTAFELSGNRCHRCLRSQCDCSLATARPPSPRADSSSTACV